MGLRRVPLQSIQNFSKPSCHHDGVISMKPKNLRASLLAYSNKTIIEVQRYCKNLKSTIIFAFFSIEVWWNDFRKSRGRGGERVVNSISC